MGSFVLQIKNKQQTLITKTHSSIVHMSIYMYIYCTHTQNITSKILQKCFKFTLQQAVCVMLVKSNC